MGYCLLKLLVFSNIHLLEKTNGVVSDADKVDNKSRWIRFSECPNNGRYASRCPRAA